MSCKLIIFTGLLAVAYGGILSGNIVGAPVPLAVAQPAGAVLRTEDYDHNPQYSFSYSVADGLTGAVLRTEDYDHNPQYSFSYSVADGLTGDNKAQEETRNGDVVQGSYSLVEPDGTRRTVSYNADPINGFNAVVQKDPIVSVKTSVAAGPLIAAAPVPILRQSVVAPQQQILRQPIYAATAGAVPFLQASGVIASAPGLRQTVIAGAPQQYLRQSVLTAPSITSSNIISAPAINGAVVGAGPLGYNLGLRTNSLYGAQSVIASNYGTGAILKVH